MSKTHLKLHYTTFETNSPPSTKLLNELGEVSRIVSIIKVTDDEYLIYLETHNG